VDVHHPHFRELRRSGDRAGDRIRNVVELKIEEYLKTQTRELFDCPRAFGREKLEPYFEEARCTAKAPR
jgi:hypothetical protein